MIASQTPPIRALLIDISGTLLIGRSAVPGAPQALTKLREAHIPFRLCSNTSKESSDAVHERMRTAGLDVRRAEVWTSIGALRAVLREFKVKRPYMLLSPSALEECMDGSVTTGDAQARSLAVPDPDPAAPPHDAVVVGLVPNLLDYVHLNAAFRILIGEDRPRDVPPDATKSDTSSTTAPNADPKHPRRPPLIALHKARYLEAADHALSLGPGPFVLALEEAARTSATVVGKPTRRFFEAVLHDLDCDLGNAASHRVGGDTPLLTGASDRHRWEGIAVIGDDVHADLSEGAVELGLWRVLVQTGKYRLGDESRIDVRPPDQVCASFSEFVDALLEQRKTLS